MTPESRNHKTAVLELDKPDASWHFSLNASFPELPSGLGTVLSTLPFNLYNNPGRWVLIFILIGGN